MKCIYKFAHEFVQIPSSKTYDVLVFNAVLVPKIETNTRFIYLCRAISNSSFVTILGSTFGIYEHCFCYLIADKHVKLPKFHMISLRNSIGVE